MNYVNELLRLTMSATTTEGQGRATHTRPRASHSSSHWQLLDSGDTILFDKIVGTSARGNVTTWIARVRIYSNEEDARNDVNQLVITDAHLSNNKLVGIIATIVTFCTLKTDGKVKCSEPTIIAQGKNIGRVNATNALQQALIMASSAYTKHLRTANPQTETCHPSPMLARFLDDAVTSTVLELIGNFVFVQRKYNGVRAIGTYDGNSAILYGRRNKQWNGFDQLKREITSLGSAWASKTLISADSSAPVQNGTIYFDGELYMHGKRLQEISGICRKEDDEDAKSTLHFVVYDVFVVTLSGASGEVTCGTASNGLPFSSRLSIMRAIERSPIGSQLRIMQFAETIPVTLRASSSIKTFDEARAHILEATHDVYEQFLREGYEGAIVRLDAQYEHSVNDRHSSYLLKIKPIRDGEFCVIGYGCGEKGKADGALMFICETNEHVQFNVTPTGEIETRKSLYQEFARVEANGATVFENKWRGHMIVVQYDELSRDGVPQRARTDGMLRDVIE